MTANLPTMPAAAKSGRYGSPPKKSHWQDPIAARVALQLGCSPMYAEKRMREANLIVELVVRAMREAGAAQRVERYVEGILRANEGREPPPDCDATWQLADLADGKEDVAESAYHRHPSLKTRQAYLDALREDRRHVTALIDLLLDEQTRAQAEIDRNPR